MLVGEGVKVEVATPEVVGAGVGVAVGVGVLVCVWVGAGVAIGASASSGASEGVGARDGPPQARPAAAASARRVMPKRLFNPHPRFGSVF